MRRLLRFLQLSAADQGLLARIFLLLFTIRLGLWLVRFDRVRRKIDRLSQRQTRGHWLAPADKLIRGVEIVARFIPGASCLTQAFAAQILLGRCGYAAILRIGVLRGENGALKAHAWIEREGKAVLGEIPNLSQFTPFAVRSEP